MTAPAAMAMSVADVMLACVALAASAAATVVIIAIVSELRKRTVTSTSRPTKRHTAAMQPSSAVAAGVDAARMENGPSNTMRVFVAAIAVTAVCTAGFTLIAQGGLGDTYKESLASLSKHAAHVVEQASAPTEQGGGKGSDVVAAPEFPSEIAYSACADAEHREAGTLVGAYGNFGGWFRNITASHADSVQLFNQGLALCYGFNQEEAARNFRQCIELDGEVAAMCHWGLVRRHERDPPLRVRMRMCVRVPHNPLRPSVPGPNEHALVTFCDSLSRSLLPAARVGVCIGSHHQQEQLDAHGV